VRGLHGGEEFRRGANLIIDADAQLRAVHEYFQWLAANDGARESREEGFEERRAA
jgi:hypothetical protein